MDRTTRALLAVIAVALWLQVLGDWLRPTPVSAQRIEMIPRSDPWVEIANGTCLNRKLC